MADGRVTRLTLVEHVGLQYCRPGLGNLRVSVLCCFDDVFSLFFRSLLGYLLDATAPQRARAFLPQSKSFS